MKIASIVRWSSLSRFARWTILGVGIVLILALYAMLWVADHID
jgi:hypothetical protein